jgi:TRAP-type uncharacterized transport system fused permease subunit
LTWKYTLPAFLVPFIFVLSPRGVGLLFEGGAETVAIAFVTSVFAVASLAVVTGAWLFGPARIPERLLFLVAAIALLVMTPTFIAVGAAFLVAGVLVHLVSRRRGRAQDAGGGDRDPALPAGQDAPGGSPAAPSRPASSPVASTAAPVDQPRTER